MITVFTGLPGVGKTASMVQLLASLVGDRPLFVHFDPKAKTSSEQVLLSEGLKLKHTPIMADDWMTAVPDGAILVIDEVQDVWRPRGSGSKVPPAVAALETHRHRGIDVFLTTQSPSLLDSNVRALVGRHVHIRDTGILGRWWYEWPEISSGVVWKTCINKKRFKLQKKTFELYKSANLHTTPVRGIPRLLIYIGLMLLLCAALGYGVYRMMSRYTTPKAVAVAPGLSPDSLSQLSQSTALAGRLPPPDESKDFKPRVVGRPWTAPAYDGLRQVVSMPIITGAICVGQSCKCYHHNVVIHEIAPAACASWAAEPSFNPYVADPVPVVPVSPGQNQSKPAEQTLSS